MSYDQSFSNGYVSLRLGIFWGHMFKNQSRCLCKKQGAAAHPKTSLGVLKCPKIVGKGIIIIPFHEDFCGQIVKLGTIAD
jgi:hypothetical protein